MTKKEIVKKIAEQAGLTQLQTKEIVQWTFDAIIETLLEEKRIELRNFGVFEVKRRKARKARNPRTDEQVFVGPKNVVTFQPGKEMEEKVRRMPLVEERVRKPRRTRAAATETSAVPAIAMAEARTQASGGNGVETSPGPQASHSVPNGSDGGDAGKRKKLKKEA